MKITALTQSYVHNRRIGAEVALHALLVALVDRGHDVSVRTMEPVLPAVVDGVDVQRFAGDHVGGDLAITNSGYAARARRIYFASPLLVWAHNNLRATLDDVDAAHRVGKTALLTNTRHMADVYLSVLGIRSLVLHPPVEPAKAQTPGDAVLMVNLNKDKGASVFWDLAAANLDRRFIAVVGGHGEQGVREAPNVEVFRHGSLDEVWPMARTLLLPSLHESYSMVGVEAAMRGIPTLARDLPGVREALGSGAVYVADDDWEGGLKAITTHWAAHRRAALTHSRSIDTAAELNTACDLAEQHATC